MPEEEREKSRLTNPLVFAPNQVSGDALHGFNVPSDESPVEPESVSYCRYTEVSVETTGEQRKQVTAKFSTPPAG